MSVVIPLRATDEILPVCSESLTLQSYRDFSVHVERRGGSAPANRNLGAEATSGEFLLFLDGDVELDPSFLEVMVATLDNHPEASYAYCSYDRQGAITGPVIAKPFDAEALRRENYISTMSLIRRSAFIGFSEDLHRLQDWDLWLRMLDQGHTGVFVEDVGFVAYYKAGDLSTADNWNTSVEAVQHSVAAARHVDIIIPTWNKSDFTLRCLESVGEHTSDYRIIWIDNGSQRAERQRVAKAIKHLPHIKIWNDVNLGFVKATNQGIATSTTDVVLLNNDTRVAEGWLDELRRGTAQGYGIVGPLTNEGVASWQAMDNVSANLFPVPRPGYHEVRDMLAFFCAYIRRAVIQDIGYLSEAYGVGFGDDDDYCYRARRAGYRLGLATNVVVQHEHRTTFKALYPDYEAMQVKNLAIFNARKANPW